MPIVKPFMASRKFTATIGDGTGTGATFAIAATTFTDDTGAAATSFPASFAYYVLYLNAQIQTADVSTLTAATITIPDGDTLDPATPVVVEVVVN
jgi:ribose 5-phosphate isomerase